MNQTRKDTLLVNSYNPFAEVTLKTRVRQLLHTHQGRDKLFKVLMYWFRVALWRRGINENPVFRQNADESEFTQLEKNIMTIQNARRLFRVGRFVAEFVRIRVTLIKCSELLYTSHRNIFLVLFLQTQMVADILARLMMCIKSVCDDIAYMSRKGFLHARVEQQLMNFSIKFYLPVLFIDLYLNTTRLVQGLHDASSGQGESDTSKADNQFSLLSRYDTVDKIRNQSRRQSTSPLPPGTSIPKSLSRQSLMTSSLVNSTGQSSDSLEDKVASPRNTQPRRASDSEEVPNTSLVYYKQDGPDPTNPNGETSNEGSVEYVDSYGQLIWKDFELHWMCITQFKILLDLFVALSIVRKWENVTGPVAIAGLCSGILSTYRVWTYGR